MAVKLTFEYYLHGVHLLRLILTWLNSRFEKDFMFFLFVQKNQVNTAYWKSQKGNRKKPWTIKIMMQLYQMENTEIENKFLNAHI